MSYAETDSHSIYSSCSSSWDIGEQGVHPRNIGPRGAVHGHRRRERKARAAIDTLAACPITEQEDGE